MPKINDTLCWRCKRPGTRSCAWDDSKGEIPVEGWTAEEVPYLGWAYGEEKTTFHVIDCPLFDPMEDYDGQERRARLYCDFTDDEKEKKGGVRREKTERVYQLFREGLNNKDVAHILGLAPRTIRQYRLWQIAEWVERGRCSKRKAKSCAKADENGTAG